MSQISQQMISHQAVIHNRLKTSALITKMKHKTDKVAAGEPTSEVAKRWRADSSRKPKQSSDEEGNDLINLQITTSQRKDHNLQPLSECSNFSINCVILAPQF
jgi:hypothetical protein